MSVVAAPAASSVAVAPVAHGPADPDNSKKVVACEKKSRRFARRSLVLKNNLKKGQKIKKKDLISLRPVKGIPSENWKIVLGKKINKNKKIGNHLLFSDVVGLKKNKNIK